LTVYTSEEFSTSELHNIQVPSWLKYDKKILTEAIGTDQYDLSLDISMLKRSSSKTSWLSNKSKYLKIRSVFTSLDTRRIISNFSINYGKIITSNTDEPTVFDSIKKNLLQQFLRDFFRKGSFRDGQVELLNKTLQNQSVIGLLPTGHGKSLVYQLSALLQPGVCLVIDPIKSLMLDQSQNLTKNGIDMQNFINSWLTQPERSNNQQELSSGKALFCFISPERLQIQEFRDTLKGMWSSRVYFSYCVIDEVHCVSEWGHDFRLSYLRLGRNATEFCLTKDKANLPLIGLTATASYDVLTDVYRELSLMDEEKEVNLSEDAIVQREDVSRDELTFKIIDVTKKVSSLSGNEWNDRKMIANAKVEIILEYLHHHRSLLAKEEGFPGLIFCPHRSGSYGVSKKFKEVPSYNEVNGVYDYLLQASIHNINLGYYVGSGQDDDIENDIIENQEKFIDNEINLLVSTKAFGMGIDKPNIRYTFHFNYPQSLEGFIQEAGRAGRDKEKAESYILFHYTDKDKDIDYEVNKFFHSLANVSEEHDKRIVDVLFRGEYFTTREDTLLKKIKEKFDEPVIRFSFKNDIWYINREFVKDRNRRNNVGSITITSEGVNKKIDSLSHKKETNSEILEYIENAILEGTKKGQLPNDLSIAAIKDWFQEKQQGTSLKNFFQKRGEESLKHILPYYIKYINEENEEEVAERGEVEKALYRLTLIGAIDDYTIDYRSHTFTMYATPREDEYFFEKLYKYIRKYYSENRAKEEVQKARVYEGESALNKCLNFLIDFVYKEIVKKREQSITDMKDACFIGLGKNGEQEFKEYADLYFNSKYFRVGYEVNGENYSLTDRTDNGKIEDIELVLMFMEVVKKDSSGSETSNLKHLRGACARLQRTQPDNATLNLLKAFCLYVLAPYDNRLIEEATDSLYKGFLRFSTYYQEWRLSDLLESIGDYVKCLKLYELTENVQENIEYVTNCLAIEAHNEWLTGFNQKFLGGLPEVIAANELKEEKRPDESDSV
ncbi:MAG: RecQ family ATP-dependent DNA helicase, partial [Candidatus Cloacimonas sp.]|nr:RecQ family ATP-dependent DNA helicase [Candidatus Cloacimonadota bacterium]